MPLKRLACSGDLPQDPAQRQPIMPRLKVRESLVYIKTRPGKKAFNLIHRFRSLPEHFLGTKTIRYRLCTLPALEHQYLPEGNLYTHLVA